MDETQAQHLRFTLKELPQRYLNEYSEQAGRDLLGQLFFVLAGGKDKYLRLFWPGGLISDDRRLSRAQGAVDGAEYSDAARGKPCGHVFQEGEPTYHCRTCSTDNTCVLCAKCYEASDHKDHHITISISRGSSGCCDCNDPEAWKQPLHCSIHSQASSTIPEKPAQLVEVPLELRKSIRATISAALDYICDVFSCSPEQIRQPKNEKAIREDERRSRLSPWYGPESTDVPEFVLMLWNDEKHTVDEVSEQVSRATRSRRSYGDDRAKQVDSIGRSIISRSTDVQDLIRQAKILARIKVTVTIRSARDTFREEMCSTLIDWLNDLAGCSVGDDHHILMNTICEELLSPWTVRSNALNLGIGRGGLVNHQKSDDRLPRRQLLLMRQWQERAQTERANLQGATGGIIFTGPGIDDGDGETQDTEDLMEIDDDGLLAEVENALSQSNNVYGLGIVEVEDSADEGEDDHSMDTRTDPDLLFTDIPRLRGEKGPLSNVPAPGYWLATPSTGNGKSKALASIYEDMSRRVRVDHLVFYDMRMWKTMRYRLRLLYISTVVAVPAFKRILSLRFATLYTHLAQLFFVADRESDHSIIYLSLQMLTSPSIAQEIVDRTNFFTRLMAIMYTFLTRGHVGAPSDVDPTAKIVLSPQAMSNRRFYHVFQDIGYLLEVPSVREHVRTKPEYLLQFLDIARIFQGICPSNRAVGEHVEWESEAWQVALHVNKEMTRMTRLFCDCFRWKRLQDPANICRAIRETAKAATISSLGVEAERFPDSDITMQPKFKQVDKYAFVAEGDDCYKPIVDCQVENVPMAFHHVLHYALSWFIDAGKSMSSHQLADLLKFPQQRLQSQEMRSAHRLSIPSYDSDQYLLAVFDIPVRVCAWAAQIRANIWVRNGYSLVSQMEYYKDVQNRDASHQRDLFMIQTGFVVCNPSRFLANVIDRFGMTNWMHAGVEVPKGFEDHQMVELLDEFLHLLIVTLSDRTLLTPPEEESNIEEAIAKRDIIHALCFKPLTHSELTMGKISLKISSMSNFEQILADVATYRPPEGLADSGTLVLREKCYADIDPYYAYYNKSQREEAENVLRSRAARETGTPIDEVFTIPRLRPIRSGVFMKVAHFSQVPLFAQVIHSSLRHVLGINKTIHSIKTTRIEALVHVLLYLALIAVKEDTASASGALPQQDSFLTQACMVEVTQEDGRFSILALLFMLMQEDSFSGSKLRVRFLLKQIEAARPDLFAAACRSQCPELMRPELLLGTDISANLDASAKKKNALARQAKVMAAFKNQQNAFMENQDMDWGADDMTDSDEELVEYYEPQAKNWGTPGGTCILCQEETNENRLFGTLAYVTNSKMFRNTPLEDVNFVTEVATNPVNLDASGEGTSLRGVAHDGINTTGQRISNDPVAPVPRTGLSKGFPPSDSSLSHGAIFSGCGHVMHYVCFEEYCGATARRHMQQHSRNHPERLDRKEFTCPLCKALGNAFMPATTKPQEAISASSFTVAPFSQWMQHRFLETHASYLNDSWLNENTQGLHLRRLKPTFSPERTQNPVDGASLARAQVLRELHEANNRLAESTIRNTGGMRGIPDSVTVYYPEDVHAARELIRAVGHSVSAAEIAQRGSGSGSGVFVDGLPMQVSNQLRILSETTSSYLATMFGPNTQRPSSLVNHWAQSHLRCMYRDVPHEQRLLPSITGPLPPFLSIDRFVYLTESSYWMGDVPLDEFYQQIRLAYLAEIVAVVLAAVRCPANIVRVFGTEPFFANPPPRNWDGSLREEQDRNCFSLLVEQVIGSQQAIHASRSGWVLTLSNKREDRMGFDQSLRRMVTAYALTFARKCALLMHIRFGIDSSAYSRFGASELERLSEILHLPTVDGMVRELFEKPNQILRDVVLEWLMMWTRKMNAAHEELEAAADPALHRAVIDQFLHIRLGHPCIFELVSLPPTFDALSAIAVTHRCPSTGGPLNDPCVCLFCGDIFCGQNPCCQTPKSKEGGCNRHVSKCGGNVGMFLNIRKCAVLLLHEKSGSWFAAPYLDRHGETDFQLRRREQLFLSQKRYDRLFREVWLGSSGGIASAVARKLEAELNTGGWELL